MSPRIQYYADLVCGHSIPCSSDTYEGEMLWCPLCLVEVKVRRVRE